MTKDINRRLKEHLTGKSKSTKYNRPITLAFLTTADNKKNARRLEVRIKNKGARLFMIWNRFENAYSDITKLSDTIRFIIKLKYQIFITNTEQLITFPEYAL
jgi:predicted GIY-YIG superfamily endonuclease